MQNEHAWVMAVLGAFSVGLLLGLWSAPDSGNDLRRLVYAAGLPDACVRMLDDAARLLNAEDEQRHEAYEQYR